MTRAKVVQTATSTTSRSSISRCTVHGEPRQQSSLNPAGGRGALPRCCICLQLDQRNKPRPVRVKDGEVEEGPRGLLTCADVRLWGGRTPMRRPTLHRRHVPCHIRRSRVIVMPKSNGCQSDSQRRQRLYIGRYAGSYPEAFWRVVRALSCITTCSSAHLASSRRIDFKSELAAGLGLLGFQPPKPKPALRSSPFQQR